MRGGEYPGAWSFAILPSLRSLAGSEAVLAFSDSDPALKLTGIDTAA
jgi:hypothetical protein